MGYCVLKSDNRLKRIWEVRGKKIPSKNSPFRKEFMEQLNKLGYENMTDQVAITTRAKEKSAEFYESLKFRAFQADSEDVSPSSGKARRPGLR